MFRRASRAQRRACGAPLSLICHPERSEGSALRIRCIQNTFLESPPMKKILVLSLVAFAACSGREPQTADSSLTADLALAAQLQSARPLPEFRDSAPAAEPVIAPTPPPAPRRTPDRIASAPRVRVTPRQPVVTQPVEPAPMRVEPAPQPATVAASKPGRASIGAGASFSLASQQRICTASNRPGDRFVATITERISGANGAEIPAGSSVVVQVASVSEEGISFVVHSVELNGRNYPVSGDIYSAGELERVRLNAASDRKKVIGGAVAGALLGQIMKKDTRGTVIGAAAGAATGAVAAKMTEKYDNCLPQGAPMRMTLSSALLM